MENLNGSEVGRSRKTLITAWVIAFLLVAVAGKSQSSNAVTQFIPSANHRYLVDQNGRPFLLQGDAAWLLIVGLSDADVELYLKNRREKGVQYRRRGIDRAQVLRPPPAELCG
jgi:hypothetical protein